jgi:hypothetical protein
MSALRDERDERVRPGVSDRDLAWIGVQEEPHHLC